MDGTGIAQIVDIAAVVGGGFIGAWDIAATNDKLYWTNIFNSSIYSADLDGSNASAVLTNIKVTLGNNRPFGITEYDGTLYFGDSDDSDGSAIYQVGTDGVGGALLASGGDARYPLVVPVPEPGAFALVLGLIACITSLKRRR